MPPHPDPALVLASHSAARGEGTGEEPGSLSMSLALQPATVPMACIHNAPVNVQPQYLCNLRVYFLDFYCPAAKLSFELDGFQHGMPEQRQRDEERERFLAANGIEELRFWNHQWQKNPQGVLLEIWNALHRRTGCVAVMRKVKNHRFIPPKPEQLIQRAASPHPSPPSDGGEGATTTPT